MSDNDQPANEGDRWLAFELHDGMLQWLVSARMHVDTLQRKLEQLDKDEIRESLSVSLGYLESALEEGRELIGFLESRPYASSADLEPPLKAFIEKIQYEAELNQQQVVESLHGLPWPPLQPRQVWNLLRVVQQAVRNALRHAGPCRIRVSRSWFDESCLQLEIHDSGQGFDVQAASQRAGHFGLSSMKHRAKLIGANLNLASQIGNGTTVTLRLPLGQNISWLSGHQSP